MRLVTFEADTVVGRFSRIGAVVDGGIVDLAAAYGAKLSERLPAERAAGLADATVGRVVYSPADLEAANPNWVGGDIYAGSCALNQNLLFRPTPAQPGHETPVERLWHIGASTHPGPGLGAGSGYLVAKRLTRPALPRRLLAKARS